MFVKLFKKNAGLKFFSLALACLLELYFYSPDNLITEEVNALVDVRNLPSDLIVVDPIEVASSNLFVKFKVRGPAPLVKQIVAGEHKFVVKAPNEFDKKFRGDLDLSQLGFPPAVKVFDLKPTAIEFRTERLVERRLPISVQTSGEVAKGFNLNSITVSPEKILVEGPDSELRGITEVKTEPFLLDALSEDTSEPLALRPVGRISKININTVTVRVSVSPVEETKTLEKVNVKVLAPSGFAATVTPSTVSAVIVGNSSVLERIDEEEVELKADMINFKAGKHQVSLLGNLSENVKVVSTLPEFVEVTLIRNK
jgi:YbbR domain-containing protein